VSLTGRYNYLWQTKAACHSTCQKFTLKLTDTTTRTADQGAKMSGGAWCQRWCV
jgi:hypothetical protein